MSTNGWIERQRLTARTKGGGTLLSWKGHVEWFTKRRTAAVIWLMRQANAALCQSTRVDLAFSFLLKRAKVAFAYTFLIDVAFQAREKEEVRVRAKTFLVRKSLLARRHNLVRDEAHQFLVACGGEALRQGSEIGLRKSRKRAQIASSRAFSAQQLHKEKRGLGQVHMLFSLQRLALEALRARGSRALTHCSRQTAAFDSLRSIGEDGLVLEARRMKAFEELLAIAERARLYGCEVDRCWGRLTLFGEKAVEVCLRQDAAADWLKIRASRAGATLSRKLIAFAHLQRKGAVRLRIAQSVNYLHRRVKNAILLLLNQEVAVTYLKGRIPQARRHAERMLGVQTKLQEIGARALNLCNGKSVQVLELHALGARAKKHGRAQTVASSDLRLLGRLALLDVFRATWTTAPENFARLSDELARLAAKDKKVAKERREWSVEMQDKHEMREAFLWLAVLSAPGDLRIPSDELIARYLKYLKCIFSYRFELMWSSVGFVKLFAGSRLDKAALENAFEGLSSEKAPLLDFDTVWEWYWTKGDADAFPPEFRFSSVVSVEDRATMVLYKRFVLSPST